MKPNPKKRRFKVTLCRTTIQEIEVEVEAKNNMEAGDKALACDNDWNKGTTNSVEHVADVEELDS